MKPGSIICNNKKTDKYGLFKKLYNALEGLIMSYDTKTGAASDGTEAGDVLESLKKTKNDWIAANANFEFLDEKEMVDYYSYVIKALQIKYEYLLRKAKDMGLKTSIGESIADGPDEFAGWRL